MMIKEHQNQHPIKVREHPLQRSSSVGGIIHGDALNKNSRHYIDSLQRFQRDYATVDKNERQMRRYQKQKNYEYRRLQQIQRQNTIKKNQDDNVNKMRERQYQSQMLHQMGAKKTAHTESIPVNPISLQYDDNYRGKYQKYLDQQNKVNKLVRAHNLQTHGTSGYNIITGQSSMHVESLVPSQHQESFEKKLSQFYSKFKLNPGLI